MSFAITVAFVIGLLRLINRLNKLMNELNICNGNIVSLNFLTIIFSVQLIYPLCHKF